MATPKKSSKPSARKMSKAGAARMSVRSSSTPAKKAPAKKAPAKKAPAKKAPAKKAPAKKAPAKKAPAKKAPAKKAPAKKAPAKKAPAKKAPAKKAPAKKAPAKKAPAKKVPTKKVPTKKVPAKKAPARKVPAKKVPARRAPTESASSARPAARPGLKKLSLRSGSPGPRYFFKAEVPKQYGATFCTAIPRDPEWVYVYWEIDPGALDALKREIGEDQFAKARRVLRLLDVTEIKYNGTNAWSHIDTEINPFADNWYIKVPQPGRTYVIECGLLTPEGTFALVHRSNPVVVPRGEVSDLIEDTWSTVDTDKLIRLSANAGVPMGSSEHPQERLAEAISRANLNAPSSSR